MAPHYGIAPLSVMARRQITACYLSMRGVGQPFLFQKALLQIVITT
tara:strand:- start:1 stop:138 length:138 start_codon:yes stop_codon:yes gene_type:complete